MLRRLPFLAAPILLVACGGGSSAALGTPASCGFDGPVPKTPDGAPPNASVQAYAEVQGRLALDAYLGPYLRGDVAVYKGALGAHDNQGVLGPPSSGGSPSPGTPSGGGYENQSVSTGPAVASLVTTSGNGTLSVHSLTEHKYVVFQQAAPNASKTTSVGIILADDATGGNTGTCVDCVPDFVARPDTIEFENITSSQVVNLDSLGEGNDDVTLHTYATASLDLVPPCGIAFADVEELNASTGLAFEVRGNQMVAEMSGYALPPGGGCYVTYTIELYVSTTNLADYGVQNFSSTPGQGCGG